jgi:hypothetical protein
MIMRKYLSKTAKYLFGKNKLVIKTAEPSGFVNWLRFANAGMLNEGNIYCFEYAIKNLPSENPLIEIGSFCGLSTNLINYCLQKNNKSNKLFTADKWEFEGAESVSDLIDGSDITHRQYKEFVKETFIRNV